ncbi:hypothetical protein I3760_06G093200 [Carya illinoinensis]|nr:hypothetical protein I3760_06G093200 [Carya illinoinensis]
MSGFVNVILSINHSTEHSGYDSQRFRLLSPLHKDTDRSLRAEQSEAKHHTKLTDLERCDLAYLRLFNL